jgi:hypothetical protein
MSRSAHDCCSTLQTAVSTAAGDAGCRACFRRSNSATRTPASHGHRNHSGHDPSRLRLNPAVGWPVLEATVETCATSSCSRRRKPWLHTRIGDACSITPGSHASSTEQPVPYPERASRQVAMTRGPQSVAGSTSHVRRHTEKGRLNTFNSFRKSDVE